MAEVLVTVERAGKPESVHGGDLVVVDRFGKIIYSMGDPEKQTFWRSCAKPVQAIPVVETGAFERFGFTSAELAVMTASHSGEQRHIEAVRSILSKIGLGEPELKCGVHEPLDAKASADLRASGLEPSEIHCNCSGKHAAMLSLAVHLGYDISVYFDPDHPVQKLILATVAGFTGVPAASIELGIDGCGVPVYWMPLHNMAWAYALLGKPRDLPSKKARAAETISSAMRKHPEMVAGTGRFDTELMRSTSGRILAKGGAEGVHCVSIPGKGLGLALKIEDGSSKAVGPVVVRALEVLGVLSEEELARLDKFRRPGVVNHRGEVVGRVVPAF